MERNTMRVRMKLLFAFLIVFSPNVGLAETILSVHGNTTEGGNYSAEYTSAEFLALPRVEVVTQNDYVDGLTTFSGPLLRSVFADLGLKETDQIELTALNDFSVTIPASDALNYDVILAVTREGAEMSVRDKGPIWVIYPMSDHSELQDPAYNNRLIWQLTKMSLK